MAADLGRPTSRECRRHPCTSMMWCLGRGRMMNFPFIGSGNDAGQAVRAHEREHDSSPGPDVTSLSTLPGVVLYQRVVTPDGQIRYTYISEGARDLFGVSPEEIVSDPNALFGCHSPEYRAMFRD